jgi:hypothetical protein
MAMEEKTTETMPGVERSHGWKPRRQQKRTLVEGNPKKPTEPEEQQTRPPDPLPFGKLDIFA